MQSTFTFKSAGVVGFDGVAEVMVFQSLHELRVRDGDDVLNDSPLFDVAFQE